MADQQVVTLTFIGGRYAQTQSGKDRWVLQANDGREFGAWAKSLYEAAMANLNVPLQALVSFRAGNDGKVWPNLHGLPSLGVDDSSQRQGGQAQGARTDMSAIEPVLNRIATAMEAIQGLIGAFVLAYNTQVTPGPSSVARTLQQQGYQQDPPQQEPPGWQRDSEGEPPEPYDGQE